MDQGDAAFRAQQKNTTSCRSVYKYMCLGFQVNYIVILWNCSKKIPGVSMGLFVVILSVSSSLHICFHSWMIECVPLCSFCLQGYLFPLRSFGNLRVGVHSSAGFMPRYELSEAVSELPASLSEEQIQLLACSCWTPVALISDM